MDEFERIQQEVRDSLLHDAMMPEPGNGATVNDFEQAFGANLVELAAVRGQLREAERQALRYAALLDRYRATMLSWARQLADAGDYDHKSKNEVLLRVVGDLIGTAMNQTLPKGDGDIPF